MMTTMLMMMYKITKSDDDDDDDKGYVPAYDSTGISCNVSCSKPNLHCHPQAHLGRSAI